MIAAFDDFIKQTGEDKTRVIVIDNASMHTNRLFRETEDNWLAKNVHIVRLPTCSPELNQIEILWEINSNSAYLTSNTFYPGGKPVNVIMNRALLSGKT